MHDVGREVPSQQCQILGIYRLRWFVKVTVFPVFLTNPSMSPTPLIGVDGSKNVLGEARYNLSSNKQFVICMFPNINVWWFLQQLSYVLLTYLPIGVTFLGVIFLHTSFPKTVFFNTHGLSAFLYRVRLFRPWVFEANLAM